MKKIAAIAPVAILALGLAATAWAGGASCTPDGAKAESASTTMTSGGHCSGTEGAMASKECTGVKANQVMYSYAVPSVECDHCIDSIQKAAMATKGIHCAHVDLTTRTAYVIADKKMSKQQVSKVITEAGFKNKFTAQGKTAQAAFTKAVASGDKAINACCARSKDKV